MNNKNTGDGELLKYFWPFPYPKHKPPIEVIFSNGMPQSDDPDHMVFQIPYNTFEQAIKKYAAQEANKARIDELERIRGRGFNNEPAGIVATVEEVNDRIAELKALGGENEQLI